jgi:hypothetical protein
VWIVPRFWPKLGFTIYCIAQEVRFHISAS